MVKEIVRDVIFLGQRSEVASADDVSSAMDLLDTLKANSEKCVGMAGNMIGVKKRIIAFCDAESGEYAVMLNPEIVKFSGAYVAEEGCLSLNGTRTAKRYRTIKLRYQTTDFKVRFKTFSGFTAQIIQHEIDHCNGIII